MGLPTRLPGRLLRLARARFSRARTAAARRPRLAATLAVVVIAGALTGTALLVRPGEPAGSRAAAGSAPTFTYSGTWSLLDLQRHAAAGEVAAVTVAPVSGDGEAERLVARTVDGQLIDVTLTTGAGSAAAALASLGHAALLTEEAWTAAEASGGAAERSASGSDPSRIAVAWGLPILMIVFLILVLRRFVGSSAGRRDREASFTTILPATEAGGGGGGGRSTAPAPRVRLADVAGCEEAKLELTETIEFLRAPARFRRLGATIPRGVLLYGPPGTGKTLLAKAVAAEADVPFIAASASEFVEKYVGVGSRRVRELFGQARRHGRAVVFVDEFDAIAKARGGANSHEEREQTLNQLLVELDGFTTTDDVVVIAATNRIDTLDPAVLRPGRFNRKIHVGLPDVAGRRDILAVHARGKPHAAAVHLAGVARKTYGFSGAQLADLLNESAILAARRGGDEIAETDVHGGWLKVAVGTSRRRSMDERERSIIAAHEVGHAICGRLHGDKRRVEEISLFAHGEALGVTVSSQEDNDLPAESDLRARLVSLMGGRAAEELLFQEVTGGAANDFEQANRIATTMVTRWGMGRDPESKEVGASGRGALSFLVARPGGGLPSEVQAAATRAIRAVLDEAYAEACRTLVDNMDLLRKLAAYLVEHERVDGETFDALVDGRIAVPAADGEWRPDSARPRAWSDIPDYHDVRRRALRPLPAPPAPLPDEPTPHPEPLPGAAAATTPATARHPSPAVGQAARRPRQTVATWPRLRQRARSVAISGLEGAIERLRGFDRTGESA